MKKTGCWGSQVEQKHPYWLEDKHILSRNPIPSPSPGTLAPPRCKALRCGSRATWIASGGGHGGDEEFVGVFDQGKFLIETDGFIFWEKVVCWEEFKKIGFLIPVKQFEVEMRQKNALLLQVDEDGQQELFNPYFHKKNFF